MQKPTANELKQLQKDNPGVVIIPMTDEEFEDAGKMVKQLRLDEQANPILKQTDESLQLFANVLEHNRTKAEFIEKLEHTPIKAAIQQWLSNLSQETRNNYAYYIGDMIRRKIIPEFDAKGNQFTVGNFNHTPHELVLDYIKKVTDWSEGTRQLHAACYISLTAYLNRISQGWFRRATPSTLAASPTFFAIRDKCATRSLNLTEWHRFIDALSNINHRDSLIARCIFQGAKRISEVLDAKVEHIDWEHNIIRYRQKKTGGMIREIPISYPHYFMNELKEYINTTAHLRKESQDDNRQDHNGQDDNHQDSTYVFITRTGKKVTRLRCNYSFEYAAKRANIKKVTPHMLRTTWVTLVKGQGVQDSEIMKVTGHTSSKMIYAYDKTSSEDNYTKKLVLI